MRQLPANSNSGATGTTENSRSRSNLSNDSSGAKSLTNGTVKEPILTRSKTRLRRCRRLSEKSSRKVTTSSSSRLLNDVDSTPRRRTERGTGNQSSSSSSSSPKNHAGTNSSTSPAEKMYARHYKSYRGLNGVKSRRGERSSNDEDSSRSSEHRENSQRNGKLVKGVTSPNLKKNNNNNNSLSHSNRSISTRNHQVRLNGISKSSSPRKAPSPVATSTPSSAVRTPSRRIRQLMLKRKSQQRFSLRRRPKEVLTSEDEVDDEEEVEKEKKKKTKERQPSSSSESSLPKKDDKGKGDHHNNSTNNNCNRVVKRRSALWVLNCEAESFLFGETAAEKHEVELPPLAPPPSPPQKKRRWRCNELGALLEKSPGVLESKLRKSSSSESGNETPRDRSPPRKRLKSDAQRNTPRRVKDEKQKSEKKTSEMCSSKAVKSRSNQIIKEEPQEEVKDEPPPQPLEEEKVDEVLSPSPKPELLSPIPFLYSPDSVDYEAKTVQFQQMLAGLDFGYSFENPPGNEGWLNAFIRSTDAVIPYTSFESPLSPHIMLPYEMDKQIRRSRTKPVRNSRKSPRCHASTLAILSAIKPTRSMRSSVTLDASPTPAVNTTSSESPLASMLLSPAAPTDPQAPSTSTNATTIPLPSTSSTPVASTSSRLPSPPKYTPSSRRRHLSSSPRPNQSDSNSKEELGAAQYLWDSIQFLSDPYVVTLLAGDDPEIVQHQNQSHAPGNTKNIIKGASKNHHRCNNNNYVNCPVKHLVKNLETSERKASLRSGGDSASSNSVNSISSLNNSRLVSVPKSSPRNHQSHHGTNHVGGGSDRSCNRISSPPSSPKANDRVPAVNGVTRRFTSRSPTLISPPSSKPSREGCHQSPHHNNNGAAPNKLSPKNSKGSNSNSVKQSAKSANKGSGSTESDTTITTTNTTNGTSNGNNGLISNERSSKKSSPVIRVSDLFTTASKSKLNNWDEESLFIGDGLPPLPSWPV